MKREKFVIIPHKDKSEIVPTDLSPDEFFNYALDNHIRWIKRVKKPAFPFFIQFYHKDSKRISVVVVEQGKGSPYCSPMDYAKGIIHQFDPDYYIVLAEVWAKMLEGGNKAVRRFAKNVKYGDIEKMAERKELLMAIGRTKDGQVEFYKSYNIVRNSNDEIIELKKEEGVQGFETRKLP
jgi:hypothetical protein